jgi:hypothetical protein
MLAKDPQQRYQTMTEVLAALDLCVPRSVAAPLVQMAASEDTRFNTLLQEIEIEPRKSESRRKPGNLPPSVPETDSLAVERRAA